MAEFQGVVKQAKRMCEAYGDRCEPCKLYEKYGLCPLCAQSDDHVPMDWCTENMSEVERIVMDWAEKHPEPRYPTWREWREANFPDSQDCVTPCHFMSCDTVERVYEVDCDYITCSECSDMIIPADIAERLGIKPIGGA